MVSRRASNARATPENVESDSNITDTIIAIIEEDDPQPRPHPQPMKDRKTVSRVPNGAELFDKLHQADYESYGQRTNDRMKKVRYHNQSYPVMYDELNRRRSMTRMSTNIRGHTANRNYRNDWQNRNKKRIKGGRVSKYRKLFMSHKACQYEIQKTNCMMPEIDETLPECSKKISQDGQIDDLQKGLDIDHDNSKPSVSSYNSVVTITNEPMVEQLYYYSPRPSKTSN